MQNFPVLSGKRETKYTDASCFSFLLENYCVQTGKSSSNVKLCVCENTREREREREGGEREINFIGMSTRLGLINAKRLENHIDCMFVNIYIFCVVVS